MRRRPRSLDAREDPDGPQPEKSNILRQSRGEHSCRICLAGLRHMRAGRHLAAKNAVATSVRRCVKAKIGRLISIGPTAETAAACKPSRGRIYIFLISSACVYYLLNASLLLSHFDLGWHLAAGDLIRARGNIPFQDPWSKVNHLCRNAAMVQRHHFHGFGETARHCQVSYFNRPELASYYLSLHVAQQ